MHPERKFAVLVFALSCAFSLALLWFAITGPNILTIGISVAFIGVTCFAAYRAFFYSDDWFKKQEERQREWNRRHPLLWILFSIIQIVAFAVVVVRFVSDMMN